MPRIPVSIVASDGVAYPAFVSDFIVAASSPSVGNLPCWVLSDTGTDVGVYVRIDVPLDYGHTPKLIPQWIITDTPGASEVLAFSVRKRAVAVNEPADGTFDAEQTSSEVVGSSGTNYTAEDYGEQSVALTSGDFAPGDQVYAYVALDASVNTYAGGEVLLLGVMFEYTPAF